MKTVKTMLDIVCKLCSGKGKAKSGNVCPNCKGCGKKASEKKSLLTK